MPKILFLLQSLEQGGAETYLLRFLEYTHIPQAYVLCKSGHGGALEKRYQAVAKIELSLKLSLCNPFDYIRFYHYIKREQFDVICDFQGNFAGWTLLCARLAHIKSRIAFYRQSRNQFRPSLSRNLYTFFITKAMLWGATRILSNSHIALEHFHPHLIKTDPERFRVIYNGFDTRNLSTRSKESIRTELGLPQDAFVIGHTGRYAPAKNHDTIISCAEILCRQHPNVYFVLMGKGVKQSLQARIDAAGLTRQIHLLDYRSDALQLLPAFNLFYFPSLNEGQPNALIEAMATGLPFVASNIPSIRESIPTNLYEHLVAPTDLTTHIKRIEYLYHNRQALRQTICQEWAIQHFDATKLFNEFREELGS